METHERPRLLTVAEVAHRLGEHRITIYKRISRGELRALRIGNAPNAPIRVDEQALEQLLTPTTERSAQCSHKS
jgi:excisionase family DNA binding protein